MKKIFVLIAFVLMMTSCTEKIIIKTDNAEPTIVILGCLSDRYEPFKITVGKSVPYFSKDKNPMIDEAIVEISSSNDEHWTLQSKGKGVYQTDDSLHAEEGVTYYLRVAYDFDEDGMSEYYSAKTTMPRCPTLDSLDVKYKKIMGQHYYLVNPYFQDLIGEDYYLYNIYVNDSLQTDRLSERAFFNDEMFDGQYVFTDVYQIPDITERDDYKDLDDFEDLFFVGKGDKITLEFGTVEEGYYDFVDQCQFEQNGEDAFFNSSPASVDTNLDNGAIGYFGSWHRRMMSVTVE